MTLLRRSGSWCLLSFIPNIPCHNVNEFFHYFEHEIRNTLHEIRQEEQHDWPICAHITIHFEYKKSGFIWEEVKLIRCKLSSLLSVSLLSTKYLVEEKLDQLKHEYRHFKLLEVKKLLLTIIQFND
jgi:hypothetical protein